VENKYSITLDEAVVENLAEAKLLYKIEKVKQEMKEGIYPRGLDNKCPQCGKRQSWCPIGSGQLKGMKLILCGFGIFVGALCLTVFFVGFLELGHEEPGLMAGFAALLPMCTALGWVVWRVMSVKEAMRKNLQAIADQKAPVISL